ncbi:MAG: GrpB family protein [Pseudomonadota bacterium]|nr:GrpB family protein [Pseudomonadota bacterium]
MIEQAGDLGLSRGLVRLAEPNVRWATLFADEAARLEAALQKYSAAIEHCGSTSVPGLPAKPILDILAGIGAPIDVATIAEALAPLGYEHAPWAGVPGHEVFGKGEPRTHLLHVVPLHGNAWKRMLAFRDALRKDAALAADYALLKQELAVRYPQSRPAYTEGKSAFVETVLARDLRQGT